MGLSGPCRGRVSARAGPWRLRRLACLALAVGVPVLLGGCSGPSSSAVLRDSARRLLQVDSFSSFFRVEIPSSGQEAVVSGNIAYRAPDQMEATVNNSGAVLDILLLASDAYINTPAMGPEWQAISETSGGIDRGRLVAYLDNQGLFDYTTIVAGLRDVEKLPDEPIEGVMFAHYRGTTGTPMVIELPQQEMDLTFVRESPSSSTPSTFEAWLNPKTHLPRRLRLQADTVFVDRMTYGRLTVEFPLYNEEVEIRPRPAAAPPFEPDVVPGPRLLGLRCAYASAFLRSRYGLPPGPGCVVLRVDDNSGARQAGMLVGDRITQLDGHPITSGRQFGSELDSGQGRHRRFAVDRGGQALTFEVTLGPRADIPAADPYADYLLARSEDDLDDAERVRLFTRAIEQDPAFDLAYLYRGVARWRLWSQSRDVREAAEADVRQALALDPDLPEAHEQLALILGNQNRNDEALTHADAAVAAMGCAGPAETWDYDCASFLLTRAAVLFNRNQAGDGEQAQADVAATCAVAAFAQTRQRIATNNQYVFERLASGAYGSEGVPPPCAQPASAPTAD